MSNPHSFLATKPVSVWNKPLKVNFKDLFKALGKAAIDGGTGNRDGLMKDLVDAAASVGIKMEGTQVAWLLIYNALTQAIFTLVDEQKGCFPNPPKEKEKEKELEELCDDINRSLEQNEVCIERRFFEHPKDLPLIDKVKMLFSRWLTEGFGLEKAKARSMTSRLSSYFVFALNDQWRNHPERYAKLKEAVKTPFTNASEQEQGWMHYRSWLQKQADEQVFGETFSLRQVYIPLRAYYEEKVDENDKTAFAQTKEKREKRLVVELEKELEQWVDKKNDKDAIRILSGGPGCGKSSFAKMFAAHQTEHNDFPVLFIPLHKFDPSEDLVKAVDTFTRYDRFILRNPLDPETGESRLLIIFDGLDELAMRGRVGAETAQHFVREVQNKVNQFNSRETRLQVLISGRELAVQANVNEFRKPGQILHILPYFLTEKERENYTDQKKLLGTDQRDQWWKNYGDASGREYKAMPQDLRSDNLTEITTQPLLNYLVALSYARDEIDFSNETNLNAIYQDLLKAVDERDWAGHRHAAARDLSDSDFIRILEEIAVAAWHGKGRTTTIEKVKGHCEGSGLQLLLQKFKEGVSQGISRLFLAFYFQQSGLSQNGNETFEFTHKSFGEYLAARRIVRGVKQIHDEWQRRQKDMDSGIDEREALIRWAKLCGQTPIDRYLHRFICDEIRLQSKDDVASWQKTLCRLFECMLCEGMPMEHLQLKKYREETLRARNAEEALLVMLNACACVSEVISKINWPSRTAFGEWIKRIQGQRTDSSNVLALNCLSFLDLENCILYIGDFLNANFYKTNLQGAHLRGANLRGAHLEGANLEGANLLGANLLGANLEGANLEGANLQGAYLLGANLQGAYLEGAHLEGANLLGAHLQWANLLGANLQGAYLRGANLRGAHLEKTIWIDGKRHKKEEMNALIKPFLRD